MAEVFRHGYSGFIGIRESWVLYKWKPAFLSYATLVLLFITLQKYQHVCKITHKYLEISRNNKNNNKNILKYIKLYWRKNISQKLSCTWKRNKFFNESILKYRKNIFCNGWSSPLKIHWNKNTKTDYIHEENVDEGKVLSTNNRK